MTAGRPLPLDRLHQDQMHQLTSSSTANRAAARQTLAEARDFRKAAQLSIDAELRLPAVSSLHEAARLAVTSVATLNGRRFSNAPGSHEAVVDYALAMKLVDTSLHAQLDQLRQLRHDINCPADFIEPSGREIDAITQLVDHVLDAAARKVEPRIPPPPKATRPPKH